MVGPEGLNFSVFDGGHPGWLQGSLMKIGVKPCPVGYFSKFPG